MSKRSRSEHERYVKDYDPLQETFDMIEREEQGRIHQIRPSVDQLQSRTPDEVRRLARQIVSGH